MFWARAMLHGCIPKTRLLAAWRRPIHVIKKAGLKKHQRAVGPAGAVCVVSHRLDWQPVWRMRHGTCMCLRTEAPSAVLALIREAIRLHFWKAFAERATLTCAQYFLAAWAGSRASRQKTGRATKEPTSAPSLPEDSGRSNAFTQRATWTARCARHEGSPLVRVHVLWWCPSLVVR